MSKKQRYCIQATFEKKTDVLYLGRNGFWTDVRKDAWQFDSITEADKIWAKMPTTDFIKIVEVPESDWSKTPKSTVVDVTESNMELPSEVQEAVADGRILFIAWITEDSRLKSLTNDVWIDGTIQNEESEKACDVLVKAMERSNEIKLTRVAGKENVRTFRKPS